MNIDIRPAGQAGSDLDARAAFCRELALSAGRVALDGFDRAAGFRMKGPQDFLTETDAAGEVGGTVDRVDHPSVAALLDKGANVRRGGSGALALAWVADGRSDGYAEVHMNAWDCLAGLLLVAEAGGRVGPFLDLGGLADGGPVIAAAPGIAEGFAAATGLALGA